MGGTAPASASPRPPVVTAPRHADTELMPELKTPLAVTPFVGSKIMLAEGQGPVAEQMLAQLDFATIPAKDIVRIGFESEQGLNTTLDGFLARLDKNTAAAVFALFARLQNGVKEADLGGVLAKIEGAKPGWFARRFSKKGVAELAQEALDKVRDLLTGRTKNLQDELAKIEKDLKVEIAKTIGELNQLERLKLSYGEHFNQFALSAAVTEAFVKKAQAYVEQRTLELKDDQSMAAREELQELQVKLQLLQSRALALEGTYTRLPADQEVIRQIEVAGVSTLGETLTTSASRFASIKMTLLSAHGALSVKSLQNLSAASAELDKNLLSIRGKLVKDVATTAAAAPGVNRLFQAEQIMQIVRETGELYQAVEAARKDNEQKFATAKASFEQARESMANLAQSRPAGA